MMMMMMIWRKKGIMGSWWQEEGSSFHWICDSELRFASVPQGFRKTIVEHLNQLQCVGV